MTYNSIYSNIFKLQNQNNLMNIPEFFLKLIVRMKKTGAKKTKMILSRSQNKKEIRNVDSVGNSKNNTLIKKYDLILNKKNEIIDKRKSSAFRIIKLKRPDKKPKSKIEFLTAKKKEKSAESILTAKMKINNAKNFSQQIYKNQSFNSMIVKNNYDQEYLIHKKNLDSNIPQLIKQEKKKEFEQKIKENYENYVNLRNYLGHLYYMNNKYNMNQTLPHSLFLGSFKRKLDSINKDAFKKQVFNLLKKLKNKNKEASTRKTLNLCIVNVCSPISQYQKDIISLRKTLMPNNNEINLNNVISNSPKKSEVNEKDQSQQLLFSNRVKNSPENNNNEQNKINNNLNGVKKYKTQTNVNKEYLLFNRNSQCGLIKSNTKRYISKNRSNIFTQKYLFERNDIKSNHLIDSENLNKKYTQEKKIEKLFNKKMITNDFDRRFSYYDTFYYKLNRMYCDQISLYMSHRINWELFDYDDFDDSFTDQKQVINFEWKYYPNKLYYKKYKYDYSTPTKKLCVINLFEKNYEIGNKKKMFMHLINYCDEINLNVFNYIPFTIVISNNRFIDDQLLSFKEIKKLVDLNKYKDISETKISDFILNKKYNEQFWFESKFEKMKNQIIYINKNFLSHKNYWMLKPTDLYQGKCIEISNSFDEISKKCKKMFTGVDKRAKPELMDDDDKNDNMDSMYNKNNTNNMRESFYDPYDYDYIKRKRKISNIYISNELIIQKYLDNPLLYRKRKFDIRCFVLVDWNLNVFFCREGHLKASSFIYDINNINKFIHITNHSFQKKSNKFERFETGNEISYSEFKNFLLEENIPLSNFDKIIKKMKFIVKLSFQAVGNNLFKTPQVLSFELFGYDFIIDNEFNPWLLEINNNPGLSISSPIIEKLIPRMMDDAFRLTIDKIFNTRYSKECFDSNNNYISQFKLEGYNDTENIFEFLCNVKDSTKFTDDKL